MPVVYEAIGKIEFRAFGHPYRFGKVLQMAKLRADGHWDVAEPVSFSVVRAGAPVSSEQYMLELDDSVFTELMSCLWKAGCRPKPEDYHVGEVAALKDHIKELQSMLKYLQRKLNNKEALGGEEG